MPQLSVTLLIVPPTQMSDELGDHCGSVVETNGGSTWNITDKEYKDSQQLFDALDYDCDGWVELTDVRSWLQDMTREEQKHVWSLIDIAKVGRVRPVQFACMLKLRSQRVSGVGLPEALPQNLEAIIELESAIASPTAELQDTAVTTSWNVSEIEMERYRHAFKAIDSNHDWLVEEKDAADLFSKSGLSRSALIHIWRLADAKANDKLTLRQFVVAMHLLNRHCQGVPLPERLPPELAQQSMLIPPGVRNDGVQWEISLECLNDYRESFLRLDGDKDGLVEAEDASSYFQQYGLPREDLKHIWVLIDVGKSGRLTLSQFVSAMQLIHCRLKGGSLPTQLPPEQVIRSLSMGALSTDIVLTECPSVAEEDSH